MRVRTGLNPGDWSENEPAVGRFHGVAAWGTRGAMVVGGTNRPEANVNRANLRTPETTRDRDRRYASETTPRCKAKMARGGTCAREAGHRHKHKTRYAMDREAVHCRART